MELIEYMACIALGIALLPVVILGFEILAYAAGTAGLLAWEAKGWRGLATLIVPSIVFFPMTIGLCVLGVPALGAVALLEQPHRQARGDRSALPS